MGAVTRARLLNLPSRPTQSEDKVRWLPSSLNGNRAPVTPIIVLEALLGQCGRRKHHHGPEYMVPFGDSATRQQLNGSMVAAQDCYSKQDLAHFGTGINLCDCPICPAGQQAEPFMAAKRAVPKRLAHIGHMDHRGAVAISKHLGIMFLFISPQGAFGPRGKCLQHASEYRL